MVEFTLYPQLASDCLTVGDLPLCRILLMNNAHFPWLILVPRRDGIRELFELNETDYTTLMQEVRGCAAAWSAITHAHKINIAALGNMVPQLHIHIIARFTSDAAWPAPVWNAIMPLQTYTADKASSLIANITKRLHII